MPTETTEQRLARLSARPLAGRPPLRPETADARLVTRVCKARGWTRTELAAELGCAPSAVSRANKGKLAEKHRAALKEMLAEGK